MKSLTPQLTATLYGQNIHQAADLYTFTFGGALGSLCVTSGDQDVVSGSTTFSASLGISRGSLRTSAELEVDTLDITIYPGSASLGSASFMAASTLGYFDQVPLRVERAYFSGAWGNFTGTSVIFVGYVQNVKPGATQIDLTAKSVLSLLKKPLPSRVITTNCPYQLFSAECGVTYSPSSVGCLNGSTTTVLQLATGGGANNLFAGGTIALSSGPMSGTSRSIIGSATGQVTIYPALSAVPVSGTTTKLSQGCKKTTGDCQYTWSNIARFGGFPTKPKQ